MGGGPYYITMPKIYKVNLTGKLSPFVSAKDVILEVLRILTVKGGVGAVIEYGGSGVKTLSVPERATITNMGAELGATTSIFPSDEITKEFLTAQNRQVSYLELSADEDAVYDKVIDIDLNKLEPMIACPHSPDNVVKVSELEKKNIAVDQVCIGSCTNSSILDLLKVAAILKGERVSDNVSLSISPGSRQVLSMLSDDGGFTDILGAGARFLECACGPCIGMGFSPKSGGVSVRTFNRNFEGRSGTKDAKVYLASPETAAAAAIFGKIVDPRNLPELLGSQNPGKKDLAKEIAVEIPTEFTQDDHMIIKPLPLKERKNLETIKGPNIKGLPEAKILGNTLKSKVALKVGDNITTDHIMPAGSKILPYRSNIPHLSQYCFEVCDAEFAERAKGMGDGIIIGGANYGQGSSREHAALVPLYLGIRAVITKSFARIHRANLINAGILPLEFVDDRDYEKVNMLDEIEISDLQKSLASGCFVALINGRDKIELKCVLSERERSIIKAGGLLKFVGGK